MTREDAKKLLPIIQAFAEGRTIQYRINCNETAIWDDVDKNYHDFSPHSFQYRIKPESKYRPFANAEECWQEMLKHQPFGWVKEKYSDRYTLITEVNGLSVKGREGCRFIDGVIHYTFADGTPFGIKEEE